ncbi:MAG: LysR family transcriptional regulator [Kiritimatiellia bacterium]
MTLQTLKYVIAIAEAGSFGAAAKVRFISQPALSVAIGDLERELGFSLFIRSIRGATLTTEGMEFLSYARQVVEQATLLESRYLSKGEARGRFAVSTQHYAFAVNAFSELLAGCSDERYTFAVRETRTHEILEDTQTRRSDIGVLYLDPFNRKVLLNLFKDYGLTFTSLFIAEPHVFLSAQHPLVEKPRLTLADLAPYPRLSFEQGLQNSFYYSEEVLATEPAPKQIQVTDRATLFNLLMDAHGYTLATGILARDINRKSIKAIPLVCRNPIEIGYILPRGVRPNALTKRYIELLHKWTINSEA